MRAQSGKSVHGDAFPQEQALAEIDDLIQELDHSESNALAVEHLKSARVYLSGAMPQEYAMSLQLALEAFDSIYDPVLRRKSIETVNRLRKYGGSVE